MNALTRVIRRWRDASHRRQSRRAIARANRLLVRSKRLSASDYDEMSDPVFLVVVALAVLVLVVDMSDSWAQLGAVLAGAGG